jgi:DNA-binding response OmpR family regulator
VPKRLGGNRMRVLVIDDEPDVLLLCRVNLQYAGHEVLEAADGERGFELATSADPDLILLDVMLPERDGISILRELAGHPVTAATPVVLLTAKAQIEDQLRGWRAGCSEYVTKPFSPGELSDLIVSIHAMSDEQRRVRRERAIEELAGAN